METFVHAQKKFLDVIAEQTSKATRDTEHGRKLKQTELSELAKEATNAFIDVQKKLIDVAGRQVDASVRAVGKTANMIAPFPFLPIPDMTREGVKSFVTAEKALIDTVMQRREPKRTAKKAPRPRGKGRRAGKTIKIEHATA
jgi:hypothetical protein